MGRVARRHRQHGLPAGRPGRAVGRRRRAAARRPRPAHRHRGRAGVARRGRAGAAGAAAWRCARRGRRRPSWPAPTGPPAPPTSSRCTCPARCPARSRRRPWPPARCADEGIAVRVVDARTIAMGLGFAVLAAARAARDGAAAEQVEERARSVARRARLVFYVDTLEHLRKGGRIGAAAALLGTALSVKPLLHVVDGAIAPLERVRTASRAVARLQDLAVEAAGRRARRRGRAPPGRSRAGGRDRRAAAGTGPGPAVAARERGRARWSGRTWVRGCWASWSAGAERVHRAPGAPQPRGAAGPGVRELPSVAPCPCDGPLRPTRWSRPGWGRCCRRPRAAGCRRRRTTRRRA